MAVVGFEPMDSLTMLTEHLKDILRISIADLTFFLLLSRGYQQVYIAYADAIRRQSK